MQVTVLGIDLAKSVFQLHGVSAEGKTILKKKLSRSQLTPFMTGLPKCQVGMEACAGAHHWARQFQKLGHDVRLIAPQFVKPFVKSNKNDAADAEAICEAVARPNMRFVAIKSIEQQELLSVHRIRSRLVKARTALSNEMRGLLHEYGIVLPSGLSALRKGLSERLQEGLTNERWTTLSAELFEQLLEEFHELDKRIARYDEKLQVFYRLHPMCQKLGKIPGIGPLSATAMVASVADPQAFKNARALSAWLGLVPRQNSSGGKSVLLGISKRGNVYLRTLLIHGARSALRYAPKKTDRRSRWVVELEKRRGSNRAAVALANKNARTIWALLARGEEYQEQS